MVTGILKRLELAGVRLEARDGHLYTIGPASAINAALAATIRANKDALIRHLQDSPDSCTRCGNPCRIAAYDPTLLPLCYPCATSLMPGVVYEPSAAAVSA